MSESILNWDKRNYMACFEGKKEYVLLLKASFDFGRTLHDFRRRLIEHYGEEGWKEFNDPPKGGVSLGYRVPDPEWWQAVPIREEGEVAFFVEPLGGIEARMTCTRGVWRIDAETMLPPGRRNHDRVCAERQALGSQTEAVRKVAELIGAQGVQVHDLNRALSEHLSWK